MNYLSKKHVLLGGIAFFMLSLFFYSAFKEKKPKEPLVYVEVTTPKIQEMVETISATGNILAQKETKISSKIAGKVKSIEFKEGVEVSKNQLLIQLDAKELEIQTEIAKSAHRSAASAIDEENYKRHEALFEEGVITKAEFDKIKSQYKAATADKERLEKTVTLQKEQVSSSKIQAPFRAIAAKLFVEQGEVVAPGQPLALLVDMQNVIIEVPIVSKNIGKISKNQVTHVTVDSSDEVFKGLVYQISQVADPISRTFETKIKVQNNNYALKPGMFAKASIIIKRIPQAVTLPKAALVKREDLKGKHIYIIENGRAKLLKIQAGIESTEDFELKTTLPKNAQVVTAGQSQLYNGAKTSIVGSQNEVH